MSLIGPDWNRDNWIKLNELLKGLQNQINSFDEGSSINEVVQARIGADGNIYVNLKSRLDTEKQETVDSIRSVNLDLQDKASTEYVDERISQSQQVIVPYNGSLADLNSDPDADTNKLYLILDESDTTNYGYVVVYDGSGWVQGWQFQSTGLADKSVTVAKLSDGAWKGISKNNAKTFISKNPNKGNYVYGADGTKTIEEIQNSGDPYYYTLLVDSASVLLSTQEFEVQAGGYFIYEVRTDKDLIPGTRISFATRITQDDPNFVKGIQFMDANRNVINSYNYNDYGYGWLFKEGVTVPEGSVSVQIRYDCRTVSSGACRFRFPTLQQGYEINDVFYVTKDVMNNSLNDLKEELEEEIQTRSEAEPLSIIYNAPSQFEWQDHPLKDKIYTDGKGNFEVKDFDITTYRPIGSSYYVDKINGDDNNTGTESDPFATITQAYNQSDVAIIYVAEGNYNRNELFYNTSGIQKNIAIIGLEENEVNFHSGNPIAWTETTGYTNVYQGNRGGSLPGVIDNHAKGEDGISKLLVSVGSIEEVESTPGSYYHDTGAGIVYIQTYFSEVPSNDFVWGLTLHTPITANDGQNLYLENVNVYGGLGCVDIENTTNNTTPHFYAKDCNFAYTFSDSYDAVMIKGVELTIFENCVAAHAQKDGFNYHWSNGTIPYALEIDCKGRDNGNDTDGNDQGSTTHDGGKIIRINGSYYRNKGANLAEDSSVNGNSQSWNLGCVCFESASPSPYDSQNVNYLAYQDTKMFMDGCRGFGSMYNLRGEFIYIRNSFFTGELRQDSFESIYY